MVTADQQQQLPDHAADHGAAVRLHISAFFHDPADTFAQFRIFFSVHDVGEVFSAAVIQRKARFCTVHVPGHQPGRIKIQKTPACNAAGVAGGKVDLPGGDDDCIPGFEGKNLAADQEHAGAAVTIADLKKIVDMGMRHRRFTTGVEYRFCHRKIRRDFNGGKFPGNGILCSLFHHKRNIELFSGKTILILLFFD